MKSLLMALLNLDGVAGNATLPDQYRIRTSTPGDCDPLAGLLRSAFEDESWTPSRVRSDLLEAADVHNTFVVQRGTEIVATASARLRDDLYPGAGYLHWVAAARQHGGIGLGSIVSLAVLEEFRRLGCRSAVLETQDERLPAIKTYLKLGFLPVICEPDHVGRWERIYAQIARPPAFDAEENCLDRESVRRV